MVKNNTKVVSDCFTSLAVSSLLLKDSNKLHLSVIETILSTLFLRCLLQQTVM